MIHPDGVRNQVEGNIIQGVSRALFEEVTFDANGVTSLDWATYPILRFPDLPELDIVLINRPEMAPLGAGEGATITRQPSPTPSSTRWACDCAKGRSRRRACWRDSKQ
jgi:nicotinate dehydrogenase subunit B